MKNKLVATKNATIAFARRHRTAITITATAVPLIALQRHAAKDINAFLKEHDLYDEYYQMDEI